MKYFFAVTGMSLLSFGACKSDDAPSCRTCSSSITPAFELCEGNNGNAFVNGQDTGVSYAAYLDGLVVEGVSCN